MLALTLRCPEQAKNCIFRKVTLLTLDSFSKLRTKNGDRSFQQKFQNCFFLSKNHQSVNFFLLNLLLFQPKLNLQFGLYICRQNHFCASCLCRKKKISSDPVLLIGINRLIPFSRLTAAVSCWRICCHIEVLLNPEKDRKSELSFFSHCCIFQPAFGCFTLQTLVKISLFHVFWC